jgi:hypothetical protein
MNSFPPACPELVNDTLIPEPRPDLTMAGETPRKTPAYMQLLSDNENAMFEKYDATREEHKKDEVGEELRALQQREAPNHAESGKLQRMQIRTLANATPLSTPLADSSASHRDLLEADYSKKRSALRAVHSIAFLVANRRRLPRWAIQETETWRLQTWFRRAIVWGGRCEEAHSRRVVYLLPHRCM